MPETNLIATVILIKLIMLALALILTHLTYSSYRRSGRDDLGALAIGFASMSVGVLLAGGMYQLLSYEILHALLVEAAFTAFGLGMIVYSLYGFE